MYRSYLRIPHNQCWFQPYCNVIYLPLSTRLLLCGDFFQLPPVNLNKCSFAFEAKCWGDVIACSILLKQIFRQNGDQTLTKILNEARLGELSTESAQILRTHSTVGGLGRMPSYGGDYKEEIKPTLLESRNAQVDRANAQEMAKLPGQIHKFKSRDSAVSQVYEKQLQHCQAPETLELKIGAQVILLKNLEPDKGLVNGSRGVIVDFQLAKNKSDLPREFRKVELPVVRFQAVDAPGTKSGGSTAGDDDDEGVTKLIAPAEWTNKVGDATVSSRQQIPLRLAWALSVHKSQGMTIPNLAVSLRGVFEYGQAYVALSRATKLDLLTLRGFDERAFKAHPRVKEFYRLLESRGKTDGNGESNKKPDSSKGSEQSISNTSASSSIVNTLSHSSNVPQSVVPGAPGSTSTSPHVIISNAQRQRMAENRRKALARKQQKQQQARRASASGSASASASAIPTALGNAASATNESSASRYFAKTMPPNPYNPYQR